MFKFDVGVFGTDEDGDDDCDEFTADVVERLTCW